MEEKHRDVLRRCHVSLVKDLVPKKILPHLIQKEIMTLDDKETINKIDKRKRQSEELMRILPSKGPRAYQELVKALEERQPSLACILLREELVAAEAGLREPINQFQENQRALNKSSNKHNRGKKRKSSKKTKNEKRETLGTLAIEIAATGVTSKKNSPEYNALRDRLTSFATQEMKSFPLTTQHELQQFCYYLIKNLDLELSDKKPGSLILTVHCRTLEILEGLWEDYCSGHLDEVAEECFHTDETTKTKEEMGEKCEADVDTIYVETTISKEEYVRAKKYLTEISDFKNLKDEENAAVENIKYKNILLKFRELLLKNLDPNEVLLQLLTAGVLTSDDKEKIKENPSQREKNEELLMMLATKGPRAYEEFVKALEKDQCFLACQLLKEEKENVLFEVREREWLLNAELEEERAITNTKLKKAELLQTRNEPFTKEQILLIQHRNVVGVCWRELGIELGIDPGRLDSLEQKYTLLSERADQVLKMWMNNNGNDATVGRLACALIDIGKEEIAERLPAFCQSEKSKQPCEREEEESERPSKQKTTEDVFNLEAEVKELREIVCERERQQKKSDELQKQRIEEWKQMKLQFQHVLNAKETLCQNEQSTQPTERKKSEDIFSLLGEVRELRRIATERETSVQQKENEELGNMIKQCKQMNIHVQNLLKKNESKNP